MSLKHSLIDLRANRAFCFDIAKALSISAYKINWVPLCIFNIPNVYKVVVQNYLIYRFTQRMLAISNMLFHLINDFASLSIQNLHILIFFLNCLFSSYFAFHFLYCIDVQVFELLLNLFCLVFIPLFDLLKLSFSLDLVIVHLIRNEKEDGYC